MNHACQLLYQYHGNGFSVGDKSGTCRITGQPGKGMSFKKWVKDTFTDHAYLYPGDIISNEAAFCFDEASILLQKKTGRDKPQRFRTYSHIIMQDGTWHIVTKADKQKIVGLLQENPQIVCLTDTGQKHIFFKHKPGFWQLDETFIQPDLPDFNGLHRDMMHLLELGFAQGEVLSGEYSKAKILKIGIAVWQEAENKIKPRRGEPIFDFAGWLLYYQNK